MEDLYKWDQALYNAQLVSQRSLDDMFVRSSLEYGYGWTVTRRPWGTVVEESGFIEGFRAYIGRFVDSRVTVILLSNLESCQMDVIRSKVSMLVFSMKQPGQKERGTPLWRAPCLLYVTATKIS